MIVKQLLKVGADVNAQESRDYVCALHTASWGGYDTIVQRLLEAGANDVNVLHPVH
jgi:ankyrin repeat protein